MNSTNAHPHVISHTSPDGRKVTPAAALDFENYFPGFPDLPENPLGRDSLLIPDQAPAKPAQRLVVVVPSGEISERDLARRVWQMAAVLHLPVLYLGLEPDESDVNTQRRRLSGLALLTSDPEIRANASVVVGKSWLQAIEKTLKPGDLLVCLAGHTILERVGKRKALGELLVKAVDRPVYMIGGFTIGPTARQLKRMKDAIAWTSILLVIAVSFGVLIGIQNWTSGLTSTALSSLSVVAELSLLWLINKWLG